MGLPGSLVLVLSVLVGGLPRGGRCARALDVVTVHAGDAVRVVNPNSAAGGAAAAGRQQEQPQLATQLRDGEDLPQLGPRVPLAPYCTAPACMVGRASAVRRAGSYTCAGRPLALCECEVASGYPNGLGCDKEGWFISDFEYQGTWVSVQEGRWAAPCCGLCPHSGARGLAHTMRVHPRPPLSTACKS